jgi:Family of unknown function (DUF6527)
MKAYISTLWRVLLHLFQSLRVRLSWRQDRLFRSVFVDDIPDSLAEHTLYLIGSPQTPWLAALRCPCGCEAPVLLNLLPEERPCWSVRRTLKGIVSLHPSIWRQVGCQSHFFLRDGRIQWCVDNQIV